MELSKMIWKTNKTLATITIVDNSLYFTGAFKAILSTSVALSENFRFIFVLPEKSTVIPLVESKNILVITLPLVELSRRFFDIILYLPIVFLNGFRLSRIAEAHNARIIHVNDYYNLVGTVAKLFLPSLKLVTHIRKMPDSFPSFLNRIWLAIHKMFSNRIIVVSKAVIKKLPPGYPARLIYDGLSEKEQYPPRKFSLKNRDEIRLLYLGHFIPGKGQDYALEAFRGAYKKCKDIRLRYIGGDMGIKKNIKFKKLIQNKAKKWNIANVVEFKDYSFDIEKEIKNSDMMLNFSESESFSFTCFEALNYGTPLIVSDSGGPKEQFKHMESGYLVPNRNVHAMVEAILYLARNPQIRKEYSIQSRQFVRENFSLNKTMGKLNKFYINLMQ